MRSRRLALGTLALVLAIGCSSQGSEAAEGQGKTEAKAAAGVEGAAKAQAKADVAAKAKADAELVAGIRPRIGGTLVVTGDYVVEILAFVDGRIEAVVMDVEGALVADASALAVVVTLAAEGEAKAKVDLAWDVELARFVGKVDAGVRLVPGPVEVAVDVGGEVSVGMLAELGLAAQASHGGQIMMAGAYSLEVVAPGTFIGAYAFDVAGAAHVEGDLDIGVEIGEGERLTLKWDPPSASYRADVSVELEGGPLAIRMRVDGKLVRAGVASFHAAGGAAARGELEARAEVEPPTAKLDAKASAGASAKGSAKVSSKSSASASGKASAKVGGGGVKASVGGKAKGKVGFKLGG